MRVTRCLFRSRRSDWSDIRVVLDGLIVAGSLSAVSWLLVMSRVYEAGAATNFEFVLLLAYPVSDLVLLTIATMVLVGSRSEQRVPITLITLGLAAMALADSGYAYLATQEEYSSGDVVVDIGWVAAPARPPPRRGASARWPTNRSSTTGRGWPRCGCRTCRCCSPDSRCSPHRRCPEPPVR